VRWDTLWFEKILVRGYVAGMVPPRSCPVSLVSRPLYLLGMDPTLCLLITSSLSALLLFWVFYRLASLDLPPASAWTALLFLVTFPIAFILFAPYSESLFLLLTVLALYSMRQGAGNWSRFLVSWRR